MAQKVQFVVTVLHEPRLLIFDEPFSGFDPINANLLKEEMLRLRAEGATIIFSTHNMASVEEICTHITLIDRARNILTGGLDEIRRQHGKGIYSLDYRGDRETLVSALRGKAAVLESGEENSSLHQLKIHIPRTDMVRGAIRVINETVEINSFHEVIPNMNDIFIKAVSQSAEATEVK
jgi:ABC-2 type transport system ATP-binding protein